MTSSFYTQLWEEVQTHDFVDLHVHFIDNCEEVQADTKFRGVTSSICRQLRRRNSNRAFCGVFYFIASYKEEVQMQNFVELHRQERRRECNRNLCRITRSFYTLRETKPNEFLHVSRK